MLIYKCGTKVKIHNYEGTIVGICIRFGNISYDISYFVNGDQKTVWLHETEFTTESTKQKIGFK
jgi:hypothetical protein